MRTFQKVKGTPIFYSDTKRFIGKISDIVLTGEEVMGYWVHTSRWWSKKHYVSVDRITHEDGDGIYVIRGAKLQAIPKGYQRFCDGKGHLFGKPLIEDSITIGIIEDVYFLPDSGMIVGYELTEGLFSDLKKGIKVVKPKSPLVSRKKSFVVLAES